MAATDVDEITVTGAEAAEILGIAKSTAASWVKKGRLNGELRGAGRNRRFEIPLSEVYREKFREEIRSETLQEAFGDFGGLYFSALNDALEQAQVVRQLRDEAFDWGEDDHERGDAAETFEKLDTAVAELNQRVQTVNAMRGAYLVLVRAASDASELFENGQN